MIDNSKVSLTSITFTNNVIQKLSSFPNLRHNVYVDNGSNVTVSNLNPDTGSSSFIYVADDINDIDNNNEGSLIDGVITPLFIPQIKSVSPDKLSEGDSTQFILSGNSFYPCGLSLAVYKGESQNQIIVCCLFFL